MGSEFQSISVTPLSSALGAEIGGIDIAAGIDETQLKEIKQAFVDYSVVFFRDQEITPDQHIEFAERWGKINVNRFFQALQMA